MAIDEFLCRDLTITEQMALASLAQHPGFEILTKLMDEACIQAREKIVLLDPTEDKFQEKLISLQNMARAVNKFVSTLRKSVLTHINAAILQQNESEIEEMTNAQAEEVLNTVRRLS
jgi:hypothetical protein